MTYRVTFYGDRKPEDLPDEFGQKLYKDFQQNELADMVELRNGLTVQRKTIREVEYIPTREENYTYSRNELASFERDKLAPYLDEKEELSFERHLAFLQKEGLIRYEVHNSPPKTASDVTIFVIGHMAGEYAKMEEKLSQWSMLKGRRRYAERMRAQELENMAHQQSAL